MNVIDIGAIDWAGMETAARNLWVDLEPQLAAAWNTFCAVVNAGIAAAESNPIIAMVLIALIAAIVLTIVAN